MKASIVNEITFYLSNQPGELYRVAQAFVDAQVDIKGLLVSEGFGKSVVRVVVDNEEKALKVLKSMDIDDITRSPILAIRMPSKIGVLAEMSERLYKASINVENIYVTESPAGDTIAYVNVEDVEAAARIFC